MDDLAACADLCESHGFAGPAAALRAIAEGRGRFHLVRAMMLPDYAEFYGFDPDDLAPAGRKVFLDPTAAERHARVLLVLALRNARSGEYGNLSNLSDEQYCREVGAILGTPYELADQVGVPVFPESATDEQLLQIAQLFHFTLFDVVAIAEPGDPTP